MNNIAVLWQDATISQRTTTFGRFDQAEPEDTLFAPALRLHFEAG